MLESREIDYRHDETLLSGFFAYDKSQEGRRPAVIVCHAWSGRDQFSCDKAIEIAERGYAGFALDVYGKGVLGTSVDQKTKLMSPFLDNRPHLEQRLRVAHDALVKQPEVDKDRIAAIGFCFGGLCVLDMVRSGVNVRGVISFHGLLKGRQSSVTSTDSKILILHGDGDPMVSFDDVSGLRQELNTMNAPWQMHVYGGVKHAFTNPQANDEKLGTVYNADADHHSHQLMWDFLAEVIGGRSAIE